MVNSLFSVLLQQHPEWFMALHLQAPIPRQELGSVLERYPWEWLEGRAGCGLALGGQIP